MSFIISLCLSVCVNCFESEYYKIHKTVQFGLEGEARLRGGGGDKSLAMEKGKELLLF
jgi:hypothetical protein